MGTSVDNIMQKLVYFVSMAIWLQCGMCRDEDKIMKACYWPNEAYEPCFGGCAEVSCDNPRNHLRPCYPYCEPGCVCEEPYVRDDRTHQCVLPQDCSPTQMGIPVPTKRAQDKPSPKFRSMPRGYVKRAQADDSADNEVPNAISNNGPISNLGPMSMGPMSTSNNAKDDFKSRGGEVSRMGNYFNIVIAPPPIKALQPRKLLQNEGYRNGPKRMN
ncbi:hypothetical protein PYW07_005196 [Mythimna separata]|uniref:TIL domain-containing protein n=1 Tax=Mythimna separata TaxID=271217 RepID=A0AAD7YDY3_MYTSE|nr:hypothetical protein PYW07_005196 [Mythimna separata]